MDEGRVKGWGPTINEINYLADYWDEVVHVACLYPKPAPPSALPYKRNNIRFASIPPYGGKTIKDKILIFAKIPEIIVEVYRNIQGASEVQLRLPTAMGLFLLPLFPYFIPRKFTFWVKYAGAWDLKTAPASYRIQRYWLRQNWQKSKVTINGFWPEQPDHCLSFENPCLEAEDLIKGKAIADKKTFLAPFVFSFVGRLEKAKGVGLILEALPNIPENLIQSVHFIGDGLEAAHFQAASGFLKGKACFHGFLPKEKVHQLLAESHFFLLPSKSEGFPKALAEAACYGVIPIVSNVGSIPHYINENNGYIWDIRGSKDFGQVLSEVFENNSTDDLKEKSKNILNLADQFSFENYFKKLEINIFS